MFGDSNQCNPVEAGSQISYNYLESPACSLMCPSLVELQYIKDSDRYDNKTFLALDFFLKNGSICKRTKNKRGHLCNTRKGNFKPITKPYKNKCYINKTGKAVNKECCDRFIKENESKLITEDVFQYEGEK